MDNSSGPEEEVKPKPIEQVLPSADLLSHYKNRIDHFERERAEILAAVDRCAVQRDETHRLEWENRKRAEEIKELQKALSDAQQFLFEERQRLLFLQAENDELKLQEIQDRQRIQQLLSMTQPLEQTVTYKKGNAPSSITSYPQQPASSKGFPVSAGQTKTAARPASPGKTAGGVAAAAAAGGGGGERVLRTVFLPTVDSDFLLLKVESLQAQLKEQKQLHEERVAALLADRQLRAQEEERQRTNLLVQVEALSKQVKQLEDALQTTTRDYITARREQQEAHDAAAAAQAQMLSEVAAARSRLGAVKRQARADLEKAAAAADSKTREYVDKFREQVRSREEELLNLTSLHTSTKAAADKRITALEGRVVKLLEANRQLELRRQLDVDGWTSDVTSLRKTLAAVDRKLLQMRLIDRLEDDERLDALLDQLEKRTPSIHKLTKQQQQQGPKSLGKGAPGGRSSRSTTAAGSQRPAPGAVSRASQRVADSRRSGGGAGQQQRSSRRSDQQQQQQQYPSDLEALQEEQQQGEFEDDAGGRGSFVDNDDAGEEEAHVQFAGGGGVGGSIISGEDSVMTTTSSSSAPSSIKSTLAAELAAVRRQLADLEALAAEKAVRAMVGPPGV